MPGVPYATGGTKPWGVAVGDLNHDGKQDLVVVNQDQNTVAVMLGNGDGTFRSPVVYNLTPGVPTAVTLADFNGDGKLDVAVINGLIDGYESYVVVLLGNGDGTLRTPSAYPSGAAGITIVAADVNGDGHQDVVVGGNGSASLLLGNGDGSFQAPIPLYLLNNPTALWSTAVADLNGDGRMDIVASEYYPDAGMAVFLQNPDGSFGPGQSYDLGEGSGAGWGIAIADFNGDNKPDVIVSSSNGEAAVFLGNGNGSFQSPIYGYSGTSAALIALADFNRDGFVDVAFANYSTDPGPGVLAVAGNGDGSLSEQNYVLLNTSGGTRVVAVGDFNGDGLPDIVTADSIGNKVSVFLNATETNALQFVPVPPCRLVDTRQTGNPIEGGTSQNFSVPQLGGCDIPSSAAAYSLNVTAVPHGYLAFLTVWPTGEAQPGVSLLNSFDGRFKANADIVPAGSEGNISIYATNTTDVVLDINGYFQVPNGSTLAYYPLPSCRVADTRKPDGPLGGPHLHANQERDFPVLDASACNIPSGAQAYSLNFTVVPRAHPVYVFTAWPYGQPQPRISTLNAPTGTIVANAAIVGTDTGGKIATVASDDSDLVIDINGYFAASGQGGLSLYTIPPCRVIDTRKIGDGQPFSGLLTPAVDVVGSPCGVSSSAQAFVLNATTVPVDGPLWILSLWPEGQQQPGTSTLNALDGAVTSNMAIVPNLDGKIDAYAAGLTQLILDISGYFAP